MPSKNERLALLLGWEYTPPSDVPGEEFMGDNWALLCAGGCPLREQKECPDFDSWEHFSELQAYILSLEGDDDVEWGTGKLSEQAQIASAMFFHESMQAGNPAFHITPAILGDAILVVKG